jgi:putative glycosyltransferase (TIGR04372 family)
VTVRDSAYLASHYQGADTKAHNFRDSNIQNVVLAAEALAERGYYVIRMGAKVRSPIASSNPKIIDYATNGMRSDFMDIYLGAKCEFCISTSTGFDAVPLIFRRPIVYINMVHLGWLFTFREQFLAIAKHHFLVPENRELTLSEIFSHGVGFCLNSADFQAKGVELVENTPEEIRDVVVEMAERLEGVWQPHEDDEKLQRKFWEIFPADAVNAAGIPYHGDIRSHFGADFLRHNQWWLS